MERDFTAEELHYTLPAVVTAAEMAEMDRRTVEEIGIAGGILMENAGREIIGVLERECPELLDGHVCIVCGKGNNGGDGYVVARYLADRGARVTVYLLAARKAVTGDAATNLAILEGLKLPNCDVRRWSANDNLTGADLIIDAILGTGVRGALKAEVARVVEAINTADAPVVAIDLPTGVETDTGAIHGACVAANLTVTMANRKRGHSFSPGREAAGHTVVVDIGIPRKVASKVNPRCFEIRPAFARSLLPHRPPDLFKNRSGQVLVLAGSPGMTGAAALTSEATLRCGTGMAILGIPVSLNATLEQKLTEVMTLPLAESEAGTLSNTAQVAIEDKLEWADAVAVGPGLGLHAETTRLIDWLVSAVSLPLLLDADALNALAGRSDVIASSKTQPVLTPHPGELARLMKMSATEIARNPVETARSVAKKLKAVLVLKGAPTVVAGTDGTVFINTTGNSGMATAGSGDVLSGIISGLLAQHLTPMVAALLGVYLHGLSGDFAASQKGEAGMLATDILASIPDAIEFLKHPTEVS